MVLDADVKVEGPLTFVSVTGAVAYAEDSFNTENSNVTYTYTVNEDAVAGASYSFSIYNILAFDEDDNEESLGNMSVSGVISGTEPAYETITLPAGTVNYTMIEGAPGTSNTLEKVATVSVIEKMNNGYTKILMGTTTYLINSTNASPGSSNSKLDKAPKTADATPTIWALSLATIAAASALSVYAAKKITAK